MWMNVSSQAPDTGRSDTGQSATAQSATAQSDTGQSATGTGSVVPRAADRDPAGLLLARLSVAPTLIATAFLLVSFPLLVIGWFRPVPVIGLTVIAAALITALGLRALPGLRPDATVADLRPWAQPGDRAGVRDARRTPWWVTAAVLVIAAGFFAFQGAYHSQFIIILRDPGSYMQFATWIAGHGKLPISTSLPAFGGAKGLSFDGFGIYQVGNSIVPQFMAGLPMALAVGFWLGGVNAALLLGPLFGTLAVLVFSGLAARLLGARWAPLAALVIAVSEPMMFTSRSTYSEPLALIMFLGGLSLVIDSLRAGQGTAAVVGESRSLSRLRARVARWDSARVLALLAGLVIGISLLVRIDAPADALPVVPYLGVLLLRRQRQAVPLIIGMAIGSAWGWYDAIFVSFPYVFQTNWTSSKPLLELIAAVFVVTVAGGLWLRRRMRATGTLPQVGEHWWLPRWLPTFLVVLPFAVLAGFGARSHFQPDYAKAHYVQLSLHWVYWYLGGPAIALAGVGAAALSYGCLRGRWPAWALPLMVFSWSIVTFLYRPGITPDQPWASRRLVPAVLPGFILLAVWATAWACGAIRRGEVPGAGRFAAVTTWVTGRRRSLIGAGLASACAVLLLVPAWLGARGTAFKQTYTHQVAAIYGLCKQIPADASVLMIDGPMADQWAQTVRGMCDVPVAHFSYTPRVTKHPEAPTALVQDAIASIERAGRRPVLIAASRAELAPFASEGIITHAVNVKSTVDGVYLLSKPSNVNRLTITAWMWQPAR
jgi:hypothetical protein